MSKLIVISAPSGTGKTSLIEALIKDADDLKLIFSISFTTRKKRTNEKHGESYFFINREEFKDMMKKNDFLESAEVFGDLYGTSKSWVEEKLKNNWNIILELDCQGALQIKKIYPKAITIFIIPPTYEELKQRLYKRDLDDKSTITKRLREAKKEIIQGQNFDHLVVNDEFEATLKDLKKIIYTNKDISQERKNKLKPYLDTLLEQ